MSWNWLTRFFTAPDRVRELEQKVSDKQIRYIEVAANLTSCLTEKSRLVIELTRDREEHKALVESADILRKELNSQAQELRSLKSSQTISDMDKDILIVELQATALRRQGTIENLTRQRDEALDMTPEKLETILLAKYPPGSDVAAIWQKYKLALIRAFAIDNGDSVDFKIFRAEEYLAILRKAFPDAKFISENLDNFYYAPSVDFMERAVRNDFGNLKPFVPDRTDCDDFAEDLRAHFRQVYGYNIGIMVIGDSPLGYHAWTLLFGFNGILMVEPQTDSIARLPEILGGYVVRKFHTY